MTELEQNINPTMNNSENTNPDIVQDNTFNSWETNNTENPLTSVEGSEPLQTSEWNPTEVPQLNASENLGFTQESETTNNEIILWKFDNPMISTTEQPEVSQTLDPSLFEHPAILESSPSEEVSAEEQQKAKLAQKEKLLQLIKIHEKKANKTWFTKWILSWIAITACIFVASCLLAKDQVIDLLNGLWWNQPQLSASIVDLSENLNEDAENTEIDENLNEDAENTEIDENLNEDVENTEVDENLNEDVENTEVDENLNEDVENTEVDENLNEDVENTEVDENLNEDVENTEVDENNNLYNITRVNSEEEANWVLPAHCSDLTCYGEDKEFTPCTTFRLSENLDENANRIGKNWVCKYKDPSELVYVELK